MEKFSLDKDRRKRILAALFDVRPVTERGDLDLDRIRQVKKIIDLKDFGTKEEIKQRERALKIEVVDPEREKVKLTQAEPMAEILPTREELLAELEEELKESEQKDDFLGGARLIKTGEQNIIKEAPEKQIPQKELSRETVKKIEEFYFPEAASCQEPALSFFRNWRKESMRTMRTTIEEPTVSKDNSRNSLFGFIAFGFLIALIIPTAAWFGQGLIIKDDVLSSSLSAYQNLLKAQKSLKEANWQSAEYSFGLARTDFLKAQEDINKLGKLTLSILEELPGASFISSGSHLIKVGEHLAKSGQGLASAINLFSSNNFFSLIGSAVPDDETNILASQESSVTDIMGLSQKELENSLTEIKLANQEIKQVKIESLSEDIQEQVFLLAEKLPLAEEILSQALNYSIAFLKILGQDNPRQYLLIFQNNSEIRATGGFIGTYGLLTLDQGKVKDIFIDGIFNADGQLHEKIIPPRPIQKISTAWSTHDANWFADFPTSAQKVAWFYEKTGGPTVDGVISFTPTVVERLLELTGPIKMPQYEVVLNSENFVELIQYKVEVDYDKELNRPKKILADFSPLFISALNQLDEQKKKEALAIILDCLKEKHILVYFRDESLQNLAIAEGWAGQLLETNKDYLSVVSSNINGYKTDRLVKETISHRAEIQKDGSIIDTLTIVREHQGGKMEYDWWNQVNANYLRVYLPLGSELISAQGQSLEIYQPPIDYQKYGFKADPLVKSIEENMIIDSKTGTHIFEESGKTVFGNWVYVSPGEKVVLTYRYKLPFKIDLTKLTDSYSLLVQKQSGSLGSQFSHQLRFPVDWQISWQYPDEFKKQAGAIDYVGDLKTDRILGVTFEF
jgi:hypothetical protein